MSVGVCVQFRCARRRYRVGATFHMRRSVLRSIPALFFKLFSFLWSWFLASDCAISNSSFHRLLQLQALTRIFRNFVRLCPQNVMWSFWINVYVIVFILRLQWSWKSFWNGAFMNNSFIEKARKIQNDLFYASACFDPTKSVHFRFLPI